MNEQPITLRVLLKTAAMLMSHAGVEQCQVVGVQSEPGQRAVVFGRCAGGFDEAALLQYCGERVTHYKAPARIVRLHEFPATAGANAPQVRKTKLREMAQALSL